MATYTYTGQNSQGYQVSGAKKFLSVEEMNAFLESKGVEDYTVFESKTESKTGLFSLVSSNELSLFCKQMSVVFYSHMTLMEGILLIEDQNDNKHLKIALKEIYEFMENGYTFSTAISMYNHIFPTYLLNMLVIGEQSGTLDNIFQIMSAYYEKEGKMRKRIRSAVAYPAMLAILMGAIVLLLILRILPMFSSILTGMGEELPAATALILGASNFLNKYIWIVIAIVAIIIAGLLYYIKSEKGRIWFDEFKLKSFFSRYITTRSITVRISRSLALLLRSGVQVLNAMEIITPLLENKYLEKKFISATHSLRDEKDLVEVFKEMDIFPPMFIKMVTIGQSVGHLDEMLAKSSTVFDDEVDDALDRLTMMIEPILIIILSLVVGAILISIMLPMIDIMTMIG